VTGLLQAALAFHDGGYCVVPARADGTKAPALKTWRQFQSQRPTRDQVGKWLSNGAYDGFGVICGAVSGQLEMLELEGRAVADGMLEQVTELADNSGLGPLWARVTAGYLEQTPSGGIHILYRVTGDAKPNTKLARNADGLVLAETRGEGGFVVVAPSAGRTHPEGKPWVIQHGGPGTVATVTEDERDALHILVSALDRSPEPEPQPERPIPPTRRPADSQDVSPADDYNQRATWDEILIPLGWTKVHQHGRTVHWRRPDKRIGVSATAGRNDGDNLYVFSTSTGFDAEKPYSKFGAYALLEYAGDFSAAAKALRAAGYGSPHPLALVAQNEAPPPTEPPDDDPDEQPPRAYTPTDDGNALRLVDAHHGTIRYCPQREQWLRWTGHRWTWDTAENIRELARAIARSLPMPTKTWETHKKRSLNHTGIHGMAALARTDPRIVVHLGDLDAQPYLLNTPAGVVDLRTGQLQTPDPALLQVRSTNVAPDFDQPPTRWLDFLADTFAGDPDITTYMQRLLGVTIIGKVLEQLLAFCHGDGANGKTTLLGAIQRVLGTGETGYATIASADMLLQTSSPRHRTEIARLSGARLVVTSELEDGQRFAEAKIKELTGRDQLSANFMRQDIFDFIPTHTLWLLANHQPAVRAGGHAFWRRVRLIPFAHTVPPEQRNPHLEDELVEAEGPAILAWMLRGAVDYLHDGLAEPEGVRAATAEYERDQDTVARFVEEMCVLGDPAGPHMLIRVAELRAEYEKWCAAEGETPVGPKILTQTLASRLDVRSQRTRDARYYAGIRMSRPDENPDDQPTQGRFFSDPEDRWELSSEPTNELSQEEEPWWQK
jgi:putative DNA primase/helicase